MHWIMLFYFLIFLIGISIFFPFHWLYKKLIAKEKSRKLALLLVTIISIPLICFGGAGTFLAYLFRIPQKHFERTEWFAHRDLRYKMKDSLVEDNILQGKNKSEVIQILGEPTWVSKERAIWQYDLGMCGAGFGFAFSTLTLEFKNDQVADVESHVNSD